MEHGPYWNGSMMTPEFQAEVDFTFESGEGGGPRFWYPLLPLGNEAFYNNITDEFESQHTTTVTMTATTLNITMDDADHFETIEWDLSVGLALGYAYEGEGPEGLPLSFTVSFVYHLPWGEAQPNWGIQTGLQAIYKAITVQNGTADFIVFNNDPAEYFAIYDDDLVAFSIE